MWSVTGVFQKHKNWLTDIFLVHLAHECHQTTTGIQMMGGKGLPGQHWQGDRGGGIRELTVVEKTSIAFIYLFDKLTKDIFNSLKHHTLYPILPAYMFTCNLSVPSFFRTLAITVHHSAFSFVALNIIFSFRTCFFSLWYLFLHPFSQTYQVFY